ncbi:heparinase II/III family protein [Novosphingobium flavum]|uniref:heparinase II/III family protein n=1 Tax=Novosphingobium aerophilum TaxID=2839843 RepID=UPI0016395BD9|nr:heparinase II/III family protein [Novosphingobium aerophilum]MBC2662405.1 heparinase II/III family protein [Novosphingobium aerophilum]
MVDVASRSAAPTGAGARGGGTRDGGVREGEALAVPLPVGRPEPHALSGDDLTAAAVGSEVIEPGRMLALADFSPPSLSPAERLVRLAYGLGLRGSVMGAFRKPAKRRLLATVANPLPGDRVAGTALRAGHFLLHGVKLPIAQAELAGVARMTPPMERYVHGFTWLADLEAASSRDQAAPLAERILAAWIEANAEPPARAAKAGSWTVSLTGTRLLSWLVHAPLILSGGLRTRMLGMIDGHARWLDRNVGRGEDLLAQLAGWCGLVAAGLLLPDGKGRRLYGEAGLVRCLGELIGDDGGTLARSPLAQMEAIALLVRLSACYRALRNDPPQVIQGTLGLLVPPLLALTHGDGSLGSWQGGWAISADEVARLIEASGVRTRPLRDARQWGYQRAVAQKTILQFDAAPPPMARHARTGCASTLAFELSHAGQRIIVNCGGAAAAGGLIPARLEQGLRATAAHSTLVLDDANSTAVLINGKIGAGVAEVEVDRRALMGERNGGATRIEASHDGYVARYGLVHRRILILRDDGTELRGEDLLVPTRGKGAKGKVAFAIRFHLGPGIEVGQSPDGQGVGLALPDGSYWQFRVGGGEVVIEESLWADGNARPVAIQQIVVQGLVSRGGGNFAWLFKRMG